METSKVSSICRIYYWIGLWVYFSLFIFMKNLLTGVDYRIIKWLKVYVIGMLILSAIAIGFWGYLVVSKAFQSQKIVTAQVKVYEAQAENVGKPIIYEQYYHSPNK